MPDAGPAELEQRIAALERENQTLRDAGTALEAVLQTPPNFLVRVGLDETLRYTSLLAPGHTLESVIGTSIYAYVPAECHQVVRACFARVRATGLPDAYHTLAEVQPGDVRNFYTRVGPIREHEEIVGFVLVTTDMTELVEARRELELHQAKLEVAVEASGIGFWTWDAATDIVTWDDATCRAWGARRATAPTRFADVIARVVPADRKVLHDRMAAAIPTGRFTGLEFRVVTDRREVRSLMTSGEISATETGRIATMHGGILDVTERKRLEDQLGQARRLEAVGQLAAGVAHNFNNMLAAIIPTVELAARRAPEAADLLGIVRESAERAASVVRQLMRFAGHRPPAATRPESLTTIAERTVSLARAMLERQIQIVLRTAPGLAAAVDPGELEQVLMNLVLNARDALVDTDRASRIVIEIDGVASVDGPQPAADGNWVRIRVRDNGVGMDDETRRRAVEPFFTTKATGSGTGLGLSSAYAVVRANDGQLTIDSSPEDGTVVTILLPAVPVVEAAGSLFGEHLRGRGERLLLIDDDALVRSALARVLDEAGYHVTTMGDPRAAVAAYEGADFDVVLLDESMPGLTGTQALAQMVGKDAGLRAISLSGLDRPITGAKAHLLKPVAVGELLRVVRGVLDMP